MHAITATWRLGRPAPEKHITLYNLRRTMSNNPESGVIRQHEASPQVSGKGLIFPFAAKAIYKVALAADCRLSFIDIDQRRAQVGISPADHAGFRIIPQG
jgi:hypothetical protein